jgi:hypothetical protein
MTRAFVLLGGIVVAATLAATSSFAAGTREQRRDCRGDAMRLCGQEIPNVPRITACMQQRVAQLSPACRKHFAPVARRRS